MTISTEHLAELLSGIARSQQAIIDAVERADGGWRNAHLIPILSVAASMRLPEPRLLDLPSRILLRYQGRAAIDSAAIVADLERLFALPAQSAAAVVASAATAPTASTPLAARMAAAAPSAAPVAAARPAASPAPAPAVPRPSPAPTTAAPAVPAAASPVAPRPASVAPAATAAPSAPAAPAASGDNLDFRKP